MLQLRINMPSAIWLWKLCTPTHQFGSHFLIWARVIVMQELRNDISSAILLCSLCTTPPPPPPPPPMTNLPLLFSTWGKSDSHAGAVHRRSLLPVLDCCALC